MKRMMSEIEARALFCSAKVGRLGCLVEGKPYVVPINYLCDCEDGCFYGHSLPGRKIAALRADRHVCLQVDQITDELRWRSVIAFGTFEEIEDNVKRQQILKKLLAHFPLLTPVETASMQEAAPPRTIVFRLRIDHITGVAEECNDSAYTRAMKEHQNVAFAERMDKERR